MAIDTIGIFDFTVFKKTEIDFCNGVNLFIGENGTGKTHLLKILYSFCECKYEIKPEAKEVDGVYKAHYVHTDLEAQPAFDEKLKKCFQNIRINHLARRQRASFIFIMQDDDYTFTIYHEGAKIKLPKAKKRIPCVYIPSKDMLTHGGLEHDFANINLPFDVTLIDILNRAGGSTVKNLDDNMKNLLDKIASKIGGRVVFSNSKYYIERKGVGLIEFAAEAEGFKKLGLIYRLIETGFIEKDSIFIWDEPESNLNPKLIPVVVDILLELTRHGVQVFIATHDYLLAKYFEVKRTSQDNVLFHSLYETDSGVKAESNASFEDLKENAINVAMDVLMDELIYKG